MHCHRNYLLSRPGWIPRLGVQGGLEPKAKSAILAIKDGGSRSATMVVMARLTILSDDNSPTAFISHPGFCRCCGWQYLWRLSWAFPLLLLGLHPRACSTRRYTSPTTPTFQAMTERTIRRGRIESSCMSAVR